MASGWMPWRGISAKSRKAITGSLPFSQALIKVLYVMVSGLMPWLQAPPGGSRGLPEAPRGPQGTPGASQRRPEAPRGPQGPPVASQRHPEASQRAPEAPRGPQGLPEAPRGSQRPPEASQRSPGGSRGLPEAPIGPQGAPGASQRPAWEANKKRGKNHSRHHSSCQLSASFLHGFQTFLIL